MTQRFNRRNSDPDYDIPRSHKPQHLLRRETSELLINNYVKKCDTDSENGKVEEKDVSSFVEDRYSDNYSSDRYLYLEKRIIP